MAGEIQQRLVPIEPPVVDGYDVAAITRPAQSVGGDFYDWVDPTGGPLTCYLGDVAGKGLSAALLMSSVLATLRGQAVARVSPGECLERANDLLRRSTAPERFATLFYASIDVARLTALTRTIVADVSAHSAGTDQTDDVTVMAIRRTA